MIVVAIIAIIAAIAYPAYEGYITTARRAEAKSMLQELALRQQRWRTSNNTYGTIAQLRTLTPSIDNPTATIDNYTFDDLISPTDSAFTIRAVNDRGSDSAGCNTLTINQSGKQSGDADFPCW